MIFDEKKEGEQRKNLRTVMPIPQKKMEAKMYLILAQKAEKDSTESFARKLPIVR